MDKGEVFHCCILKHVYVVYVSSKVVKLQQNLDKNFIRYCTVDQSNDVVLL